VDMGGASGEASSGSSCLVLLLRFHGIAVDPAQVSHRFGGGAVGVTEMLRCARELKLKSRVIGTDWQRLARLSLPAIAECHDGAFVILGKAMPDRVMVQDPALGRPQLLGRATRDIPASPP
jgi:subfamily B ATP-binding cassette protein HlyB/CyaB